jgi:hypothetical protein
MPFRLRSEKAKALPKKLRPQTYSPSTQQSHAPITENFLSSIPKNK